jgi:hypothetical protein
MNSQSLQSMFSSKELTFEKGTLVTKQMRHRWCGSYFSHLLPKPIDNKFLASELETATC